MTALSNADGPAIAQAIKAELGLTKERMCDIGGSKGILLSTILEAHEGMTGVVLDLEYVVKDCVSKGRLEFQAGDMFKEVPVADVYILKVSVFVCLLLSSFLIISLVHFSRLGQRRKCEYA